MKIVSLFLAFVLMLSACKSGSTVPIPNGDVTTSDRTVQNTPRGARVFSENGVTLAQLEQVDAGLTQAFDGGLASGWPDNGKAYNYSLYIIYIPVVPCVLSPVSQTPSFLVRADNYDGSIYDYYNSKGELPVSQQNAWQKYYTDGIGVVYAAEMVRTHNTPGSTVNGQPSVYASFVVCPQAAVLQNGTQYGAEHTIIAHYDLDYYLQTQTHSTIGHPLLPKSVPTGKGYRATFVTDATTPIIKVAE